VRGAVTWLGHSTVLVELDGARVLIDPVLRPRVAHLKRYGAAVDPAGLGALDAVLISHQHRDHLDLPTLRRLPGRPPVLCPRGARAILRRGGMPDVAEVEVGEATAIGRLPVLAVPADHDGRRLPRGPARPAVGFLLGSEQHVYHAGDTDLFDGMGEIGAGGLALALVPIWGWGSSLGPGHLDPAGAARAVAVLKPDTCVPIHYGTYAPAFRRGTPPPDYLTAPLDSFLADLRSLAPDVTPRPLAIGETLQLP
jgi:L-ascorbate metabolism protein UlaG (beta-lactamase superfamily)